MNPCHFFEFFHEIKVCDQVIQNFLLQNEMGRNWMKSEHFMKNDVIDFKMHPKMSPDSPKSTIFFFCVMIFILGSSLEENYHSRG